jgi:hypothetical protein
MTECRVSREEMLCAVTLFRAVIFSGTWSQVCPERRFSVLPHAGLLGLRLRLQEPRRICLKSKV